MEGFGHAETVLGQLQRELERDVGQYQAQDPILAYNHAQVQTLYTAIWGRYQAFAGLVERGREARRQAEVSSSVFQTDCDKYRREYQQAMSGITATASGILGKLEKILKSYFMLIEESLSEEFSIEP